VAYIGLDRGIIDHWIYQDAEYFKVWFEMLYRARFAHEPHTELVDGEIVVVNYSEFIFGRIKWSARLKVSEQRLRTLIKKLKAEGMIEVVSEHRKCTLYAIKNYAKFNQQSNQQSDQSQQGDEGTGNQQSNQPSTSSQPAANQQPTTKEERKKVNNDKKVKELKTIYAEQVSLTDSEYQKLIEKYGTEDNVKAAIEKLSNYKCSKKTKYTSDYHVLIGWVYDDFKKKNLIVLNGGAYNGQQPSYSGNAHANTEPNFDQFVLRQQG
jgi:hypothetical protein